MTPLLEVGHQLLRYLLLGLAHGAANTQPGIHIQRYATPDGAALLAFGIPPLSPLLPT